MTRLRLRPAPSEAEMERLYPEPHQHLDFGYGHTLRVDCTIALGASAGHDILHWDYRGQGRAPLIVDLSCGDAAVPQVLSGRFHTRRYLGDYAHSPHHNITGPIEHTLPALRSIMGSTDDHVDLFICGETLEHLDDPDVVLNEIGTIANHLLLSTPEGEPIAEPSAGHLWAWDHHDLRDMLFWAGWDPDRGHLVILELPDTLSYQIWLVRRRDEHRA